MSSLNRVSWSLGLVVLAVACRKAPPVVKVTPAARASGAASASSAAPAVVASKPAASAARSRQPTPLDAAGLRAARSYLAELSHGRKATVAKDYAEAEEHFSKALEALPGDPRALAERGYARLLASKLPEAEADLRAAIHGAPSSAVLLQIYHNLMLVARQRGDEKAAKGFEEQKQKLKAARRLPSGLTCESEVVDSELKPQITSSIGDALKQLLAAHATEDGVAPSAVEFSSEPFDESIRADGLKALAAKGPLPEAGWQLWASGNQMRNHALIAHAGKLYGFPNQSSGSMALCGWDQAGEVTIGGGGARPWYIQRTYRELARGYTPPDENGQTMGFCTWTSTKIDVTILDSKTFEGIRTLSASARPTDEDAGGAEPEHLLELEWQADRVIVDACGQHSVVTYARAVE